MKLVNIFIMTVLLLGQCIAVYAENVVLGIERQNLYSNLLNGKRVGLLTNQTGVDHNLRSSVNILRENFNLTAVFVPEHGFYGAVAAGEEFKNETLNGITVYSLYKDSKRPSADMLADIDIMCIDLQDIGIRHYTYVSTMAYVMEECARYGKPVVIFDRPNPLGGESIEGPVLKPQYKTFIGLYEMPLRHGLTIGEYARFINSEYKIGCQLYVIPMQKWHRKMLWQDTGLLWVGTSPLIPTAETAFLYGVTGVTGDTNLSVGAATAKPFYYVGAEFADENLVADSLNKLNLAGVKFRPAAFIARSGKYQGKLIKGAEIYITDYHKVNLPELGYRILYTLRSLYPDKIVFPKREYAEGYKTDIALGESSIRENELPETAFARWHDECAAFKEKAKPYLLYK